jgi:diguanylate cyclase (GGDEF)-like protein
LVHGLHLGLSPNLSWKSDKPLYALIAEFDPQRAAIYRRIVEERRLEAVLVRDGDSAREVIHSRGAPALLITDLSLPQADGFALIADLRRTSPADRTAILVFSAFAELRAAAWNLRGSLGISEIGEKNLPLESVEQSVARALASIGRARPDDHSVRPDPQELFRKIVVRTSKAFRAPIVVLSVEMREKRRVMAHMDVHELHGSSHLWPVIQQVSHTRQPLIVPDVAKQSLFGFATDAPAMRIRGFVAVPLLTSNERLVGVLSLLDLKTLTLSPAQLDLLLFASRRIADQLERELEPDLAEAPATEQMRASEKWAQLARLALTDRLTGLSNRHAGERALERDAARARRAGSPFSLALLDLDNFKQVNDRYGHAVGDEILRQVSQVLASTFRASDLAVRWGGDEFLILLPDVAAKGAGIFAERARMQIETLTFAGGNVTISGGVVEMGKDESPRDALERADAQLYEAKRGGRNRVKATV